MIRCKYGPRIGGIVYSHVVEDQLLVTQIWNRNLFWNQVHMPSFDYKLLLNI